MHAELARRLRKSRVYMRLQSRQRQVCGLCDRAAVRVYGGRQMERRGGAPVPLRLAGERRLRGKQVQELDESLHRLRAARRQFPGRYQERG